MVIEKVFGYFTIESHLVGADTDQITKMMGFPPIYLRDGARILVIVDKVRVGEFLFAGSTWYPGDPDPKKEGHKRTDPKGLVSRTQRGNFPIPGSWLGQRLVKVKPARRLEEEEKNEPFIRASSPIEQWQLLVEKKARLADILYGKRRYSPR